MTSMPQRPTWRLLGDPSISWGGRELTPRLGKKAIGVIAYLALASEGAGRDDLARKLWPPAETAKELARAKHSLRQCLVTLRKAFGDGYDSVFQDADDWLKLRPDAVEVDVQLLCRIEATDDAAPRELAELCRGPFLRALTTRARPFDGWMEETRAELTQLAGQMLEAAHAEAEQGGDRGLAAELRVAMDRLGIGRANLPATESAPVEVAVPPMGPPQRRWLHSAVVSIAALAIAFGGTYAVSGQFRTLIGTWINPQDQVAMIPRISVLPLTTLNDTADERGLANAVQVGINQALSAISELFPVIPAPTTERLGEAELVIRAKELGVRYMITGTVGVDGDTFRVWIRCLDTQTLLPVCDDAERIEQKRAAFFKLQDDITLKIVKGLQVELSTAERNRIQYLADTNSLDAWLAAAQGVSHLIRVTQDNVFAAEKFYKAALHYDPDYVSAHRGLAWVAFLKLRLGWVADSAGAQAALGEAREHLDFSLEKQPTLGTNKSLEGAILLVEQQYSAAIDAGEAAVADLPNSADTNAVFAHTLTYVGEHDRALQYIDKAMELSEIHPAWYRWTLGRALRMAGRFDESVRVLEQDFGTDPPIIVHLVELTASYAAAGRMDRAQGLALGIKASGRWLGAQRWMQHPPISVPEVQAKELEYLISAGL